MVGFVVKKLCFEFFMIKLNFEKYIVKVYEVCEIFVDYDFRFESVSIDEVYFNIIEYCEEKYMNFFDVVE